MTKAEFLAQLIWHEGPAPEDPDSPWQFDGTHGPLVCELDGGAVIVVGECNYACGLCDHCREYGPSTVARYAYLWSEV